MKKAAGLETTILLVDDDVDLLEIIQETIAEAFTSVLAVDRAQKALDLLKTRAVDCIVTDYRMPEMSGLEFIDALAKNHPSIPVILLTGNGSDPEVVEALQRGVFDYLDKPFNPPVLINRIRNSLLLPRLEGLIVDLAKAEFPDIKINGILDRPFAERLSAIVALEGIIRMRLLAREGKRPG
jgi:DNA-binding NtrC family response regulator